MLLFATRNQQDAFAEMFIVEMSILSPYGAVCNVKLLLFSNQIQFKLPILDIQRKIYRDTRSDPATLTKRVHLWTNASLYKEQTAYKTSVGSSPTHKKNYGRIFHPTSRPKPKHQAAATSGLDLA